MFEAVKKFHVHLFFVVPLWDDEEHVFQCAECLTIFRAIQNEKETENENKPPPRRPPPKPRATIDEREIDAELAALKERIATNAARSRAAP